MDHNGYFDYGNFFCPGPMFPVRICPVSGDPRFPFHIESGAPNNTIMGDTVLPTTREHNTTDGDRANPDQQDAAAGPPSGSMVVKCHTAAAAQATTTAPAKLEHVMQGLSHHLEEAKKFCGECLQAHKEVVDLVPYAGHGTRNALWRELLESKFEDSGVHKDLMRSLVPHVRQYTQQAQLAARDHPRSRSDHPDDKDWSESLMIKVNKLVAECALVDQLSKKALGNKAACDNMIEVMTAIKGFCDSINASCGVAVTPQEGQEGGDTQYQG
ncbi:hypothetical protein diail_1781 [Diaporthe ilicicola]|nr:hypothetical protein diail_1781 [Diaporthe ilicicola]